MRIEPAGVPPERLIAAARALVDTPFHKLGRKPGPEGGLDCIGLLVVAMRRVGLAVTDERAYSHQADWGRLREALDRHGRARPRGEAKPGDALLFRIGAATAHLGIATETMGLIHAYAGKPWRRVVEWRAPVPQDPVWGWAGRLAGAWAIRGVG